MSNELKREDVNLSVEFAGIKMKNPLFTASGTCGFGHELDELGVLEHIGGIMTKGTTLAPRLGNPTPRICETPSGVMNCVGLQNPGLDYVMNTELPWLTSKDYDLSILCNIAGSEVEQYGEIASRLDGYPGIKGLEVNISCPNVKSGGMAHGAFPESAAAVTRMVRKNTSLPIIMKLSPNVTNIVEIARAVEAEGADGISLINTLLGMKIDIHARKPFMGNTTGGLSGPAIRPIGVRMVYQVAQAVNIPIIGMGGIATAEDAIEYMMAGASAFAVGASTMMNGSNPIKIIEGLKDFCVENNIKDINEIVGAALPR